MPRVREHLPLPGRHPVELPRDRFEAQPLPLQLPNRLQPRHLLDPFQHQTIQVPNPVVFLFLMTVGVGLALRCMPRIEKHAKLVCLGFFEDEATWAGASLTYILNLAGVQEGATRLFMTSADGYENNLTLEQARRESNFLAYEWEGEPLPVSHGFPVRAALTNNIGGEWVKWLVEIDVA